eukprot:scaffold117653_cov24-Attheya_sp.AAC.1
MDQPLPPEDWEEDISATPPPPPIHTPEDTSGIIPQDGIRRSTRNRQPTQRMMESVEQESLALAFQHDETMER